MSIVEELSWKLERIGEGLAWKIDRFVDKVGEWEVFTSIWLDDFPALVQGRLQEQKLHFQKAVEGVGVQIKEAGAWLIENAEKAVESIRAKINEVGTWLSDNVDKVALGVGVAGGVLGVAGLGPEKIREDVEQFYQDAVVVVQVDLKERVAAFLEEVKGLDDFAKQIISDMAQGKLPFSSHGEASYGGKEASYEGKVDPNYGERLDPKDGPEPW